MSVLFVFCDMHTKHASPRRRVALPYTKPARFSSPEQTIICIEFEWNLNHRGMCPPPSPHLFPCPFPLTLFSMRCVLIPRGLAKNNMESDLKWWLQFLTPSFAADARNERHLGENDHYSDHSLLVCLLGAGQRHVHTTFWTNSSVGVVFFSPLVFEDFLGKV